MGIKQDPFQRMFNIGNVFFASAATGDIEVIFKGVKDPVGIKSRVNGFRQALVVADKKSLLFKGKIYCYKLTAVSILTIANLHTQHRLSQVNQQCY